jgi:hypothetical protein
MRVQRLQCRRRGVGTAGVSEVRCMRVGMDWLVRGGRRGGGARRVRDEERAKKE